MDRQYFDIDKLIKSDAVVVGKVSVRCDFCNEVIKDEKEKYFLNTDPIHFADGCDIAGRYRLCNTCYVHLKELPSRLEIEK